MEEAKETTKLINPEENVPDIRVTRSLVYRGRPAVPNHAWFIARYDNKKKKEKYEYAKMHLTKGLYEFQELALKGNLVKEMREKFKF